MDKYDIAVEELTKDESEIIRAWGNPSDHKCGCLFAFASKSGSSEEGDAGCLTMIRNNFRLGGYRLDGYQNLIDEIKTDERIPKNSKDIKVSDLRVFAEWQRKLDLVLKRA